MLLLGRHAFLASTLLGWGGEIWKCQSAYRVDPALALNSQPFYLVCRRRPSRSLLKVAGDSLGCWGAADFGWASDARSRGSRFCLDGHKRQITNTFSASGWADTHIWKMVALMGPGRQLPPAFFGATVDFSVDKWLLNLPLHNLEKKDAHREQDDL